LEGRVVPAVFTIADGDTAAFIAAVSASNADAEPDTINLAPGGTYTFTTRADTSLGGNALPTVGFDVATANTLTINGNGATVQRSTDPGTPTFRFLKVGPSNATNSLGAVDVVVADLTIKGFDSHIATEPLTPSGGAVFVNRANVRLTNCTLTGNTSVFGGAVAIKGLPSHTLTLDRCTVVANEGGTGVIDVQGANLIVTGGTIAGSQTSGGIFFQPQTGSTCAVSDAVLRDNAGSGIEAVGDVTLQRMTITGNARHGVIAQGRLTVTDSTISGNGTSLPATFGGGLSISASAGIASGLTVTNCTISGNTAATGSGIDISAGNTTGTLFTITNSTITNNVAAQGGGVQISANTNAQIGSSVVAGNGTDVAGTFTSLGYNFIGNGSGATIIGNGSGATISGTTVGNQVGTAAAPLDPRLGPLRDNGGPTLTRLPLPGSPLIDAGNPVLPPALVADQRGRPRVQNGRLDIGAVELQQPARVASVMVNDGTAQRSRVTSVTVTFNTVVSFAGSPASAFRLTRTSPGAPADVTLAVDLTGSTALQTVARLTFSGPSTEFGSLGDGNYALTVAAAQVSADGLLLDGDADGQPGGDYVAPASLKLYRLFGDANGDRVVNETDLGLLRGLFGATVTEPTFDVNGDGVISAADLGAFRARFGASLP
jgi:hypothetical protein